MHQRKDDHSDDREGCACGASIAPGEETSDADLPVARGGVETVDAVDGEGGE